MFPKPSAAETWFQESVALSTAGQGLSQLSIAQSEVHSQAQLPYQVTSHFIDF
jgi:hypothetical protein